MTRSQFAAILWRAAGSPTPSRQANFDDVPRGSYFDTAVSWMVEQGTRPARVPPGSRRTTRLTRGQVATFIWRYRGRPSRPGGPSFSDVPAGAYYAPAVRWMADEGITLGTTPTEFSPHLAVNRAQAVTFLWRDAGSPAT